MLAFLAAPLAVEGALRLRPPAELQSLSRREEGAAESTPKHPANGLFELDAELGVRPKLGGRLYGEHGCLRNNYPLAKAPGKRRWLFIGDSVTARGAIVEGLKQCFDEADPGSTPEMWNAGVEGYGMRQTSIYFQRHLTALEADRVFFTFHLNDFDTTPVMFVDGDRLVVYTSKLSTRTQSSWLYRNSILYRLLLARRIAAAAKNSGAPLEEVVDEVEEMLVALRKSAVGGGARFTVLIFPWLSPVGEWPREITAAHTEALRMLRAHGIEFYDPVNVLEEAMAEGEDVRQRPNDPQHPSKAFGLRLARALVAEGLRP